MRPVPPVLPLTALALGLAVGTLAGVGDQAAKLLASDGAPNDWFGSSVALRGNLALVGASEDDDNGSGSGSAYLLDATTGLELMKLLPSDGFSSQRFGITVALHGTTAVVGGEGVLGFGGGAYVFDALTGQELHKLVASDGPDSDYFGKSVGATGTRVVVGAYRDEDQGTSAGAAYLYELPSGQELFKLLPSDGEAYDHFGYAVAVDGDVVLVGAPDDGDNGKYSGSAWLFDAVTGQELHKLLPFDGAPSDGFGGAVAIAGGVALVGASQDQDNGPDSGSAYLFDVATGQQLAKLLPTDGATDDRFGARVAISGTTALVGAALDDDNGGDSGSAYLFDVATGKQISKLLPDDGAGLDWFGVSVAIDGERALVGALWEADNGFGAGAAYLFDLAAPPIGASYCGPAVPNSSGNPAVMAAYGSDLVADDCVRLEATDLPAQQFGYFLTSQTQGFVANPGGSQGNLCLRGTIGRYAKAVQSSGPDGTFGIWIDLNDMPKPVQTQVLPGETWSFQAWFRDKNPMPTSNFTDGVAIGFN